MKKTSLSPDEIHLDSDLIQPAKKEANKKKNEILKKMGMPKDPRSSELKIFGNEYFFNYELSWLKFNERVLAEVWNPKNKLLERVRFLSIVCSNLDEFFQKRVGGLKRQIAAGVTELSVDGLTPADQLKAIRIEVKKMIESYRSCFFDELKPKLHEKGLYILAYSELNEQQKAFCDAYFQKQVYPIVTPLAVDEAHPFPFISNKSLSFAIDLMNPNTRERLFARLKIPANRNRFVLVEQDENHIVYVPIEDIIRQKLGRFFPGLTILSANMFRVTRNASIERNEEEAEDLLEVIEDELRERKFAGVVRLEVDAHTPDHIKKYLITNLDVHPKDVYEMSGPIGLADVIEIANSKGFDRLKFDPWVPVQHPALKYPDDEQKPSIFEIMRRGDFMVHHPYHSFELSTQRFVEEAARDPKVLAIKQTLYRTSKDSPLMLALMAAVEEGKQVAVLVEIKARFDEERNINWAQKLEDYGVHVAYGLPGLKIHCKLTMVVREEEDGLRTYCHIGTGNYHPDTAQLYEDLALFTCDETLTADVTDIFNLLTGYAPEQQFEKMLVAPRHMRNQMKALIQHEIEEAKKGKEARIIAKMNSLEDPLIIQQLYEASAAGVKIDLIVRGVCMLIPGKKNISENIQVHSVIGRFLEHSRIYYFHHSGEHKYFIGSADWMHRNLDARVEAISPIEAPALKKYLQYILSIYLRDNTQRWILSEDGTYARAEREEDENKISTHHILMHHMQEALDPVPQATE